MSLTSTPPLPVKQVIYTSSSGGKLTFILATPYLEQFFLGSVVITRATSGYTSGKIDRGADATHGGKASVYVSQPIFADLHAQAIVPFKVVLSYDTVTNDVVDVDIIRELVPA